MDNAARERYTRGQMMRVASSGTEDLADVLSALRQRLLSGGYTAEALRQRLGIEQADDIGLLNHAATVERLGLDRAPATALMRLFFLEEPESEARIAAVLSRRLCGELISLGLLKRQSGTVRTQLRIDAVEDQYFLADRRFRSPARRPLRLPGADPVYPPSADSLMLRDATVAPQARRVLDLCTGSAVQALRHAHSAERLVAVDRNPRAAATARLNAALNGNVELDVRLGDLYAPVRNEQFDLIIANPPFVISPYSDAPAYHSGGRTGDSVLRRVIAGWTTHLSHNGRAFAISYRGLRTGETMDTVARAWFRDFHGRALVLVLARGSAVDFAAAQSLFALRAGLRSYAREIRRWVDHLRRLRIHTIALLLIAAERTGQPCTEVVEAQPRVLSLPLAPSVPDQVRTWFG